MNYDDEVYNDRHLFYELHNVSEGSLSQRLKIPTTNDVEPRKNVNNAFALFVHKWAIKKYHNP